MINNVTLVGRMTKEPELKQTQKGSSVTNFTVAVDRSYPNQNGEKVTDFINCVAWRKTAESVCNLSAKGSLVGVMGSINTRSYENNNGETVYVTEVLVNKFRIIEPKKVTMQRKQGNQQYQNNNSNQNINSNNNLTFESDDPFSETGENPDFELPF